VGLAGRLQLRPTIAQPLTTPVSVAGSGDTIIVGAATIYRIRVLAYMLVAAGTVLVQWKSGVGTSALGMVRPLSGAMPMVANGSLNTGQPDPAAWLFQTELAQPLVLNLSAAIAVTGHVTYTLETD
jgi:hypothetical protein